jgi:hypothetical protein
MELASAMYHSSLHSRFFLGKPAKLYWSFKMFIVTVTHYGTTTRCGVQNLKKQHA